MMSKFRQISAVHFASFPMFVVSFDLYGIIMNYILGCASLFVIADHSNDPIIHGILYPPGAVATKSSWSGPSGGSTRGLGGAAICWWLFFGELGVGF